MMQFRLGQYPYSNVHLLQKLHQCLKQALQTRLVQIVIIAIMYQ